MFPGCQCRYSSILARCFKSLGYQWSGNLYLDTRYFMMAILQGNVIKQCNRLQAELGHVHLVCVPFKQMEATVVNGWNSMWCTHIQEILPCSCFTYEHSKLSLLNFSGGAFDTPTQDDTQKLCTLSHLASLSSAATYAEWGGAVSFQPCLRAIYSGHRQPYTQCIMQYIIDVTVFSYSYP